MVDAVEQEVNRFVPRIAKLEDAFAHCLEDDPSALFDLSLSGNFSHVWFSFKGQAQFQGMLNRIC